MNSQTFGIAQFCGMRKGISFTVTANDHRGLVAIVTDRCAIRELIKIKGSIYDQDCILG